MLVLDQDQAGPVRAVTALDDEEAAGGAVGDGLTPSFLHQDPGLVSAGQAPEQSAVPGPQPPPVGGAGQTQRLGIGRQTAVPGQPQPCCWGSRNADWLRCSSSRSRSS